MTFIDSLKETLLGPYNTAVTENGAVGFRTTGRELLDLHFAVASLRRAHAQEIYDRYAKAFYEDARLASKWLMYASDVRAGLGERRLLRVCLTYLAENHPQTARALLPLVPEYSRWDNVLCLLDTALADDAVSLIRTQLAADRTALTESRPISLCAKWMPSENASSPEVRRLAGRLAAALGMTRRQYRQLLSSLRKALCLTETAMSAGRWEAIDYETVPSRANLLYRDAFLRHDKARRHAFLEALTQGTASIRAQTLYPHDIVHSYFTQDNGSGIACYRLKPRDEALEALWAGLPDYVQGNGATLCVADGSGSMRTPVGHTGVTCLDVANALAIYFAERCEGAFHDAYITFSQRPQLVPLSGGRCLRDKIEIARRYSEIANTDIEAVFNLILETARRNRLSQKELPANVLILSDMEFDIAAHGPRQPDEALFAMLGRRYARFGYRLPRLVFWNIGSRTGVIPLRENELGVTLVSGFSSAIAKMVLSGRTDPFECLLEQLQAPRYAAVDEALAAVM